MLKIDLQGTLPTINSDFSSAMESIAVDMQQQIQENFLTSGHGSWAKLKTGQAAQLIRSGKLYRSTRRNFGNNFAEVGVGEDIPYAGIHHSGGTTHPSVTLKSKKIFWAKWYQTGDEMWKRMALKQIGSTLNVHIPARPWMFLPQDFFDKNYTTYNLSRLKTSGLPAEGRFSPQAGHKKHTTYLPAVDFA